MIFMSGETFTGIRFFFENETIRFETEPDGQLWAIIEVL
jgi:hypothetical protein